MYEIHGEKVSVIKNASVSKAISWTAVIYPIDNSIFLISFNTKEIGYYVIVYF